MKNKKKKVQSIGFSKETLKMLSSVIGAGGTCGSHHNCGSKEACTDPKSGRFCLAISA